MTTRDKVVKSVLCLALGFLAMEAWKQYHKKPYPTKGLVFRWSADDLKGYTNGQPVTNWGSSKVSGSGTYADGAVAFGVQKKTYHLVMPDGSQIETDSEERFTNWLNQGNIAISCCDPLSSGDQEALRRYIDRSQYWEMARDATADNDRKEGKR
jgi:hypothetical protein